jgi:hypothetical protein
VTPIVLVVAFLATYSLTLLVVCDKITDRPRQWVLTRISGHGYSHRSLTGYVCTCGHMTLDTHDDPEGGLGALLEHIHDQRQAIATRIPMSKRAALLYLVRCPWCASAYVAVPVVWSGWCFGDRAWWFIPAAAIGLRAATGAAATYANPRS